MSRPIKCRRIYCNPDYTYFKPRGIPLNELEEIQLTLDEVEAIRLADKEGLYQEDAASKMKISRQTFGNILNSAHKKIAEFLIEGKVLKIEGGNIEIMERHFTCYDCKNEWKVPCGTCRPGECPKCKSKNICRVSQGRCSAKKGGFGRGSKICRRTKI
jgi:predicted DNA-binding protein (UPF0251 family)